MALKGHDHPLPQSFLNKAMAGLGQGSPGPPWPLTVCSRTSQPHSHTQVHDQSSVPPNPIHRAWIPSSSCCAASAGPQPL